MDKGVKRIPPDMQPSDDGGLIQMENAPNQQNDKLAYFIFGLVLLVVVVVVFRGVNTLSPPVQEWIESKINPEPTAVVLVEGEICPEVICPEQVPLECPVLVCPGCDPCPTVPDDQVTDNREEIGNYLLDADEILTYMEAAIALMEEVGQVMWSFGNTRGEQRSAFNDAQWNRLVDDADNKVEVVRYYLSSIWPPGPYNSCNPILDAHTRMLLAFAYLDSSRDKMLKARYENDVDKMPYFYVQHEDQVRNNIVLARLQLAKVR